MSLVKPNSKSSPLFFQQYLHETRYHSRGGLYGPATMPRWEELNQRIEDATQMKGVAFCISTHCYSSQNSLVIACNVCTNHLHQTSNPHGYGMEAIDEMAHNATVDSESPSCQVAAARLVKRTFELTPQSVKLSRPFLMRILSARQSICRSRLP